ncbi:pyrroloquinoline quinone biosynthesis peptide chaperone PqqD [Thiorhodococcus minor]|uniref:PqqA binding protein n=1 Tax=Thiorhodococcus minor TaxID=57489 RepID=A0A6M0K4U9_9GAMM|nr:pyrroloquinoline quinone biosynthesis peptide chaperone PqqD [Thiorhodococcus minor]NEV64294.1 pyrroloquinoline quinone biosynthesis peptide chaperone PqqD [Thiorhodococcus minor]
MSGPISPSSVPAVSKGFRLQWEEAQGCHVLLYPEGMVKLNGPAGEILKRCDGARSAAEIIQDLERQFPGAEDLSDDVYQFLSTAHDNQWIRFAA